MRIANKYNEKVFANMKKINYVIIPWNICFIYIRLLPLTFSDK